MGKFVVKFKYLILTLAIILLVPSLIGTLATKVNYDMLSYLPDNMETVIGQDEFLKDFGKDAFTMIITEDLPIEEQAKLEAEIEQLDYQIRNARIVTEEELNAGKVNLGLTVTIKDLKTKEVFDYKIVGITESDPLEGLISNESPVGSALMGKQKGDKIEVVIDSKDATEGTVLHYQILDIKKQ